MSINNYAMTWLIGSLVVWMIAGALIQYLKRDLTLKVMELLHIPIVQKYYRWYPLFGAIVWPAYFVVYFKNK
jgi:hypothetical protein